MKSFSSPTTLRNRQLKGARQYRRTIRLRNIKFRLQTGPDNELNPRGRKEFIKGVSSGKLSSAEEHNRVWAIIIQTYGFR